MIGLTNATNYWFVNVTGSTFLCQLNVSPRTGFMFEL